MRNIAKVLVFVVVFSLGFGFLQHTFHYRFKPYSYNVIKYNNLENVDVVFIGTSETWCGISPIEIYGNTGITSFNLGHAYKSSPTFCREVEYVLSEKRPKYIVLDFSSLYSEQKPQDEESVYRNALYSLPNEKVKIHLLMDIWKYDKEEFFSFAFPLLRYHDMWKTKEYNVGPEYSKENVQLDYLLGWNTYGDGEASAANAENTVKREIKKELWNTDEVVDYIPDMDKVYYDKIISMCADNNTKIIAICPPRYSDAKLRTSQWETTKKYFDDNNIIIFNYNTYESAVELGLDWNKDFYNEGHLNYKGAIKWSRKVAEDLQSLGITDHRQEKTELTEEFDDWYDEYREHYENLGVEFD